MSLDFLSDGSSPNEWAALIIMKLLKKSLPFLLKKKKPFFLTTDTRNFRESLSLIGPKDIVIIDHDAHAVLSMEPNWRRQKDISFEFSAIMTLPT